MKSLQMTPNRFPPISVFLHWLIFLLFAAALVFIEYGGYLPKGDLFKKSLRNWHMIAGQLAFLFVMFRVVARLSFAAPAAVNGPRWQALGARAVHGLLYAVMFALPISGVLFTQAGGKEVEFFSLVLPTLIAPDAALKVSLKNLHGLFGNAVYFLVAIHVLGALWHEFVQKDAILSRMSIPLRRQRPQ
jgi:cytochrome b561